MNPFSSTSKRITKVFGNLTFSSVLHGASEWVKDGHFSLTGVLVSPVLYVMSEVFAHFTSEQTTHIKDDVLDRFGKNPYQLNHNLQALFVEAVKQAIEEGIPSCFVNEKNVDKREPRIELDKNYLTKLKELSKQFEFAFAISSNKPLTSAELIKYLDEQNPVDCLTLYKTSHRVGPAYYPDQFFPTHHFPHGFVSYFKHNFFPIVRILFIEGLKSKEFEKARIAYEQMMAEETYRSLTDIKDEIVLLKKSGEYAESKYAIIPDKELTISIEKINSVEDIQLIVQSGLNLYFQHFDKKLDDLLELSEDTNIKVTKIDIKTDRIEKGISKNLTISYFLVTIAVIIVAWAYIQFSNNSPDLRLRVEDAHNKKIKSGFAYLDIRKTESNEAAHILGKLNDEGILTFEKIPKAHLENDTAELSLFGELEDKYKIADTCRYLTLKNAELKTIVLVEDPGKKNVPVKNVLEVSQASFAGQPVQKLSCDIEGVDFKDELSETNHITFHGAHGNVIGFTGSLEIEGIHGEMSMSGSGLKVKTGNVKGSLSLVDNCKTIIGMLTLSNGANINISYSKK